MSKLTNRKKRKGPPLKSKDKKPSMPSRARVIENDVYKKRKWKDDSGYLHRKKTTQGSLYVEPSYSERFNIRHKTSKAGLQGGAMSHEEAGYRVRRSSAIAARVQKNKKKK